MHSRKECDDILHKLGEVAEFYGRQLEPVHHRIWLESLSDQPVDRILIAFDLHIRTGKYMPKPADILEQATVLREQTSSRHKSPPPVYGHSTPRIANAWCSFMKHCLDFEYGSANQRTMPFDEALLIANQEAYKYGCSAAIPAEYKLDDIWK